MNKGAPLSAFLRLLASWLIWPIIGAVAGVTLELSNNLHSFPEVGFATVVLVASGIGAITTFLAIPVANARLAETDYAPLHHVIAHLAPGVAAVIAIDLLFIQTKTPSLTFWAVVLASCLVASAISWRIYWSFRRSDREP